METISLIRKNTIVSLFPIKVKNTKFTDNFPLREKVEKIPSFSERRKMYPLTGGNIYISLTVKGGRKAGLSAARRPSFPCPLTEEIFTTNKLFCTLKR